MRGSVLKQQWRVSPATRLKMRRSPGEKIEHGHFLGKVCESNRTESSDARVSCKDGRSFFTTTSNA